MAVLPLPDYTPVYPATKAVRPRQRTAKFPNWGIEQRGTEGQNQTAPEWSVKWILTPAQANDLDSFLAARAKSGEWFLWIPPSGISGIFRCDDWSKTLTYCDIYEVQATFRQVYDIRVDAIGDGFALSIAASLVAGATAATTNASTTGFTLSVAASLAAGAASVGADASATGFELSVAASLEAGAAFPDAAPPPATDPSFNSVLLLLHGDGANNGTVFTDSSSYARTGIVAADIFGGAATAVTSTAVKKYGTASVLINGGQDYLSVPYSADWLLGSGDFTLEAWIYMTGWISGNPGNPQGIMCRGDGSTSGPAFAFSLIPGNGTTFQRGMEFRFGTSDTASTLYSNTESGQYALNTWHHVAAVRNGSNLRLFCNGVQAGSTYNVGTTAMHNAGTRVMQIGRNFSFSNSLLGYIDDVRITKGVGRYTANFTPPTAAFPDAGLIIGSAYGGGYFAGYISHTANGVPTHALVVAPAATGATGTGYTLTTMLAWKTVNTGTSTPGTTSPFDGAVNTAAMVAAGIATYPAAQFCVGLSIGGYTDWYLPSHYELDIAYQNLKPTTTANDTTEGINPYSVPERTVNYTTSVPAQTSIAAFQSGGAEAFVGDTHVSSTEVSGNNAWYFTLSTGNQTSTTKTVTRRIRAFRKVAL